MKSFIKIPKEIFKSDLWNSKEPFCKRAAWIDLIQLAKIGSSTASKKADNGRHITWGQGQYPISRSFLVKRWNWSAQKVRTFISYLVQTGLIICDNKQGISVMTIINFEQYNGQVSQGDTDFSQKLQPMEQPMEQPIKQPAEQPTLQPTRETSNLPYNKTLQEDKATEQPMQQPIPQPIEQPTLQPIMQPQDKEYKNKENINKERIISNDIIPKKAELSLTDRKSQDESIDFDKLMQVYNDKFKGRLPLVQKMTDQRKAAVRARVKEYGKEKIMEAFQKVYDSDFCNGANRDGWKATFDFIFQKSSFLKILEGAYDDRKSKAKKNPDGFLIGQKYHSYDENEQYIIAKLGI